MVKLAGVCIILLGCTGVGYSIVQERKQELINCAQWQRILAIMENEMAFQKASIHEICFRISRHSSVTAGNRDFFLKIAEEMEDNKGQTLGDTWKREMQLHLKHVKLPENMKKELSFLGEKLCYEDVGMQRKVIKMLEEELEQIRTDRAQEDEKRNKVTMCMGIMTGLLITIILF